MRKKSKIESKKPAGPLPALGTVAVDPKRCVIVIHGPKKNDVTHLTAEALSTAVAAPLLKGEAKAEICGVSPQSLDSGRVNWF